MKKFKNIKFKYLYKSFIMKSLAVFIEGKELYRGMFDSYYLIVEQKKNLLLFHFANIEDGYKCYKLYFYCNKSGYPVFNFIPLQGFPKRFYSTLKKRGLLFTNDYENNHRTTVQRLIAALKYNIKGLQIHHIDFDIKNNHINNLFPLEDYIHGMLHLNLLEDFENEVNCIKPLISKGKEYYSYKQSDEALFFILICYKCFGLNPFSVIEKFSFPKISKRTFYRILNKYRQFKDFLKNIDKSSYYETECLVALWQKGFDV